jgi:cytochrome c oxidase cbb3-type subunit 4
MDLNTLRSISTVLSFVTFLGILWWAFSPRSSKSFEEAARLPFADDETRPGKH